MKNNGIYGEADRNRIMQVERWDDLDPEDRRYLIDILFQNDNNTWPQPLGKLYGLLAQHLLRQETKVSDGQHQTIPGRRTRNA